MKSRLETIVIPPPPEPVAHLARVLTGAKKVKYAVAIIVWCALGLYFWSWWLTPDHVIALPRFLLLTAGIFWLFFLQVYFIVIFFRARKSVGPMPSAFYRIAMIVTKTPSEPFAIVRRTLEAMLAQDLPHDTWLADEDPTPETEKWCKEHGVKISTRKGVADYHRAEWPRRTRCKEGNLAYFYDHYGYENYDFVAQLDADHVPEPNYLTEVCRPFSDPAVGYVSAPSMCSNNAKEHWAARTRLHTEAAFHGVFQCGYSGGLAPLCIGSHYAVRTSALKQIGGLGPELAEDHSTSLIMNANGWRGVHALDAIAHGDGPASVSDLATQEFQWSRSLVTLLLRYTPTYLPGLSLPLKIQFLFCQMFYPFFAFFMALMYALPVAALVFDMRYAEVTYPDFLKHSLPVALTMIWIAYQIKRDDFFRPHDVNVITWEKALFLCMQWPWVLWGCVMAFRDRLTGGFVDFRITPKGEAAQQMLPTRVLLPYVLLALGCILPVLLISDINNARGFYLLALINGLVYTSIVIAIVINHIRENGINWSGFSYGLGAQLVTASVLVSLLFASFSVRALESTYALTVGTNKLQIARAEYLISGAGISAPGTLRYRFDPKWKH